jgi:RimJ/RimL family protein N-acetyltransferase
VLGAANPHEAACRAAVPAAARVRFERDASDMRSLMAWADCAVLAGGVTALEACAAGLPALLVTLAENQAEPARALDAAGAAQAAGEAAALSAEALGAALAALAAAPERLAAMGARGRALVDGSGADRVVSALRALGAARAAAEIRVRPTVPEDALEVWRLANEPGVRANSFRPEAIPLDVHLDWFRAQLGRGDTRFWVVELGGVVAAQVRYVRSDDGSAEVHFAVRAAFQGRGLGTEALRRTASEACRGLGAGRLRGVVIAPNPASERAFEKAGYSRAPETTVSGRRCSVFEKPCS